MVWATWPQSDSKKPKTGGEMVKKECDAIDVRELLALVYADLKRLAREGGAGGDEDAEIQANDRTEKA